MSWENATVEVDPLGPAHAELWAGQIVVDAVVVREVVRGRREYALRAAEKLLAVLRGEPGALKEWRRCQQISECSRQIRIF